VGSRVAEAVGAVLVDSAAGPALVVLAELAGGAVGILSAARGALIAFADESGVAVGILEALRAYAVLTLIGKAGGARRAVAIAVTARLTFSLQADLPQEAIVVPFAFHAGDAGETNAALLDRTIRVAAALRRSAQLVNA